MKLLKVAAIAAIVFSGSALAGVVPQYGGGGNHGGGGNNSGPNSELNTDESPNDFYQNH